jgi:GT2 family glycosyltransferase
MRVRLGIIILHYKNFQETIDCVLSALRQQGDGYEIVIVDNGSNDGSFEMLKKLFGKVPHVTVKRLKKNLGFARGNNYGIRYIRTKFGAENCFICNSDVVFEDTLFEELLAAEGKGIGVISPSVYDADSNPQPLSINTKYPYRTIVFTWLYILYRSLPERFRKNFLLFLQKTLFKLSGKLVRWLYGLYIRMFMQKLTGKTGTRALERPKSKGHGKKAENIYQIQGCAFLLTKEYFRFYNQLYPRTFLYGEELNLLVYLKKAGLRAVAAATSPVIHKGKQSSYGLYQREGEKRRLQFVRHSLFHSLPLLFMRYNAIRKQF